MVSAIEDPKWLKPSWNSNEEGIKGWEFYDFKNQVKSDIENFKWLFQIEDDKGTGGKYTWVQLIAINNELSNC